MTGPAETNDVTEDRENWLAQGEAVSSGAFLKAVADDPGVRLLNRIASDILLLEMTASRAGELKNRFGSAVVIERDQSVNLIE